LNGLDADVTVGIPLHLNENSLLALLGDDVNAAVPTPTREPTLVPTGSPEVSNVLLEAARSQPSQHVQLPRDRDVGVVG
jgi:hypothetical protein